MKRLFTLLFGVVMLFFTACDTPSDNTNNQEFTFDEGTALSLTVSSDGGIYAYHFTTTTTWSATLSESWLSITPDNGTAESDTFTLNVESNEDSVPRTATVTISYGKSKEIAITVTQEGMEEFDDSDMDTPNALPDNEIWYTTTDGNPLSLSTDKPELFGTAIKDNTYADGKGVITFEGSVTCVGGSAFKDCTLLKSITLPNTITEIKSNAFSGCSSLRAVDLGYGVTTLGWCSFFECDNLRNIAIPSSVTTISQHAFAGCDALKRVTVGTGITTIDNKAFYDCYSLKEFKGALASEDGRTLVIDGTLYAFAPAELSEYSISEGVTKIANATFSNCFNLTRVVIPESITEIGDEVFESCTKLSSVECLASVVPTAVLTGSSWRTFDNNGENRKIYVRDWLVEDFKQTEGWNKYAEYIEGVGNKEELPTSGELTLEVESTIASVGAAIKFTVLQRDYDVTGHSTIYDAATKEPITGSEYTPKKSGQYTFYATRGEEESNHVTITVVGLAPELPEDPNAEGIRFKHRILIVDHTAVSCGYCPQMIDKLLKLQESEWGDSYSEVTCHAGGLANGDPARSEAADVVYKYFGAGQPNLSINFRGGLISNLEETAFMNKMNEVFKANVNKNGADVGIAVATKYDSNTVYASATIKSCVEKEYRVTAWLLENDIYSPKQAGAIYDYHRMYHHALRNIAGQYDNKELSGNSIGVIKEGESIDTAFELPILGSDWKSENMEVLIIVSALNHQEMWEVVNTAVCPINSSKAIEYLK